MVKPQNVRNILRVRHVAGFAASLHSISRILFGIGSLLGLGPRASSHEEVRIKSHFLSIHSVLHPEE
jgi:hypothetical protein